MAETGASAALGDVVERDRPLLAARAGLAVLLATLLAALVVPGSRAGLGLALAAVSLLAAAAVGSSLGGSSWRTPVLGLAMLLAAVPLFRDALWLVVLDLAAAALLAGLSFAAAGSGRAVLAAAGRLLEGVLAGPYEVARSSARMLPRFEPGAVVALARAALLTAALVAVFAALFVSADGAFAQVFGTLSPDVAELKLLPRLLIACVALALGGGLALLALPREQPVASTPRRSLAPIEWGAALTGLVLLFTVFVVVQFVVLFGGQDHVLETAGLTYAEYAREGFAQLVVVAVLVLGVTSAALRYSQLPGRRERVAQRTLLTLLGALTLVILVSSMHRLDLYTDAFGATRARGVAAVLCVWIAAVLIAAVVSLFTRTRTWLVPAVMLVTGFVLIGLTAANPDRVIAERNIDRYESTGRFDASYNAGLSADAVPALDALPAALRAETLAGQEERLREPDGSLGFNLARAEAGALLD